MDANDRAALCSVLKNDSPAASDDLLAGVVDLLCGFADAWCFDVDAFSKHAKRKTITVDDVLLLARRNPKAASALKESLVVDVE